MKLKIFFSICTAVMLTLSSCKDVLNLYPTSAVTPGNITEKDIVPLTNGIYNTAQNNAGSESYILFDLVGGNLINSSAGSGSAIIPFIENILRPENGILKTGWNGYYRAIYYANTAIQSVEDLPSSTNKNTLLGTAYFFRALTYYNLVTRWGGVPLLTVTSDAKIPRNSEAEVWTQIEQDLSLAMQLLPSFNRAKAKSYFYVSSEAAKALMARVKLMRGDKPTAAILAEEIITSGTFQLDDYSKIFRGQDNTETIFSFANILEESSVNLSGQFFYTYSHSTGGSYVYKPTNEAMNLYTSGDNRKDYSATTYNSLNIVNKFPSGQAGRDPLIIIRLSEMFLISAEAKGHINGIGRLNDLRSKRGLTTTTTANETHFLDLILEERRKELYAEGFRYYDLVRTNRLTSTLGISDHYKKFPIPSDELMLNNQLEPNEGYSN
ncbi:RagB/SusD family nutrient uptake outer membrane protein [Sphingobacterium paucimobilis]|nr:RagB/SusD family nutrient uptake outer membrane protein [Sphingobacterium paucimobilis]